MINRKDIDLIEAYLNGELPEAQRLEVEQRLLADDAFREEMEFQRQMHEHFWDEGRQRFRALVQGVAETDSPGRFCLSAKLWVGLLSGLLTLGFFVWHWLQTPNPSPLDSQIFPLDTLPKKVIELKVDSVASKPAPFEKKRGETMPIAKVDPANFAPNPSMEIYIGSKVLGPGDNEVEMITPIGGTTFWQNNYGKTVLHFVGKISGVVPFEKKVINLLIFDNKHVEKPILAMGIEVPADSLGNGSLDFRRQVRLVQGVYYYCLEEKETGGWLIVEKFFIGKL